jgi:hypothetical protein
MILERIAVTRYNNKIIWLEIDKMKSIWGLIYVIFLYAWPFSFINPVLTTDPL